MLENFPRLPHFTTRVSAKLFAVSPDAAAVTINWYVPTEGCGDGVGVGVGDGLDPPPHAVTALTNKIATRAPAFWGEKSL